MFLLIGYGNPLRSDDGVGQVVADMVAGDPRVGDLPAALQTIACQQLLPEHAQVIAEARRVVFIDAAAGVRPGDVNVLEVEAGGAAGDGRFHAFSPAALLAFAEQLYGRKPPAILVTIGGFSFEHGDALSSEMTRLLPQLRDLVIELLGQTPLP